MKAARLETLHKPLQIRDIAIPAVGRNGILVKVKYAGVCHSDVHLRDGGYGPIKITKDLGAKLPITLGHEIAGIIEEVGEDVKGFSAGESVVVDPWIGDGTCRYCINGLDNICDHPSNLGENTDGGYAEFVNVPDFRYVGRISNLSPEAALLSCSGLTAYSAIRKGMFTPEMSLLIVGAGGGLGTMTVQLARVMGSPEIIAADINKDSLQKIRELGANHAVNVNETGFQKEILSLTNGYGPDVIIDLNASDWSLGTFIPMMAKGGKYIMVGLYGGKINYKAPLLINFQRNLLSSVVGTVREFKELIQLFNNGYIKSTVNSTVTLKEVNTALDNLKQGNIKGRQVVKF